MSRANSRRADELRPVRITRGYTKPRRRLGAGRVRRHQGAVHRERRGEGAAVPASGKRRGLGHRRVRHAAARDPHAQRPRGRARQAARPHAGDPAPDRPLAARGGRPRRARRAHASRSTATCCRPTAARAPRRSPAPSSRSPTRSRWLQRAASCSRESRCTDHVAAVSVGIVERRAAARPRLRRGLGLRHRHERRHDRRAAASSRCRARPKAQPFSRDELDALLDLAANGHRAS